ncbi:unnamed protein product, partial [Nesidiocoris tenuis]
VGRKLPKWRPFCDTRSPRAEGNCRSSPRPTSATGFQFGSQRPTTCAQAPAHVAWSRRAPIRTTTTTMNQYSWPFPTLSLRAAGHARNNFGCQPISQDLDQRFTLHSRLAYHRCLASPRLLPNFVCAKIKNFKLAKKMVATLKPINFVYARNCLALKVRLSERGDPEGIPMRGASIREGEHPLAQSAGQSRLEMVIRLRDPYGNLARTIIIPKIRKAHATTTPAPPTTGHHDDNSDDDRFILVSNSSHPPKLTPDSGSSDPRPEKPFVQTVQAFPSAPTRAPAIKRIRRRRRKKKPTDESNGDLTVAASNHSGHKNSKLRFSQLNFGVRAISTIPLERKIVKFLVDGSLTVPVGEAGAEVFNCPDDFLAIRSVRLCGQKVNDASVQPDFTQNAPVIGT